MSISPVTTGIKTDMTVSFNAIERSSVVMFAMLAAAKVASAAST